jgi:hypothetical protein
MQSEDEIKALVFRLRNTPLYHSYGESADLNDDAADLIESQQRTIARLSAPMSWDEYNSIFPAATDPMAAPPEILLHPHEVWNLLMDMRKEHLDHE